MKFRLTVFLLFSASLLMFSCDGNDKNGEANDTDTTAQKLIEDEESVIHSLPSPFLISKTIQESNAPYRKDVISDPADADKYSTSFEQAFALGVYTADMGYVIMYDQTQKSIDFYGAANKLADGLGLVNSFDENQKKRVEDNLGKQDSMLRIVNESYENSKEYLNKNERPEIAALVIAGGWVEGTWLATSILSQTADTSLRKRVGEEKLVLPQLIRILGQFEHEGKAENLIASLKELNEIYQEVEITHKFAQPVVDEKSKVTKITNTSEVTMSDETLQKISQKIGEIRNEYI